MKKVTILIATLFATIQTFTVADETDWSVTNRGFVHFDVSEGDDAQNVHRIRPVTQISHNNSGLGAFVEFELAATESVNGDNANWIEQLYVSWDFQNGAQLRVGRLFLSHHTPPPFLLPTINYYQAPIDLFAYGAQSVIKISEWKSIVSVTGDAVGDFHSENQFEEALFTGWFTGPLTDDVKIGLGYQAGTDSGYGAGGHVELSPMDWLNLKGGGYVHQKDAYEDGGSGFGVVEYVPCEWCRPHVMVDHRTDGDRYSFGAGFYKGAWKRLLVDYQSGDQENMFTARAQFSW